MKLLGVRQLSVLLVGTLLLCHGLFGSLHLFCNSPECVGDAEHQAAAGGADGAHEHSRDHGTSAGYFAVLVFGLLGLCLGLRPKHAPLQISLAARWPAVLRRVPAQYRPPPTPTPTTLQVFRL